MDVNAPVADPSSAAPQAVEVPRDPKAYSEWRQTGKVSEPAAERTPKQPKAREAAAPSKESSAADADDAGTEPASEPGDKQEQRKRGTAETRLQELLADLKTAGLSPAELKTFKREAAKAEAQKEPEPAQKQAAETTEQHTGPKAPVKPKVEDFETYDAFETAKDKYFEDLADHRAEMKLLEREQRAKVAEQQKEVNQKLADAKARYGETAESTIADAAKAVFSDEKIPSAVKALINDSPVMVDLLFTLGSKESVADFVELAKSNPGAAIRKAVLLEHLVSEELGKGSSQAAADTERDENGKFTTPKPPAKKVTDAPPPPREVSGRSAAPPDEVASAVKTGDFKSFQRAQNSRDMQRRKGI